MLVDWTTMEKSGNRPQGRNRKAIMAELNKVNEHYRSAAGESYDDIYST